ncbi:MAG: hypothetical protein ACK56F_24940, partial [bacterium]
MTHRRFAQGETRTQPEQPIPFHRRRAERPARRPGQHQEGQGARPFRGKPLAIVRQDIQIVLQG